MASSIEVTGDSLVVAGAGPHPILASDLAQQGPTTTAGSTSLRAAIPCTIKTPRTGGARARLPQFCHSPGTATTRPCRTAGVRAFMARAWSCSVMGRPGDPREVGGHPVVVPSLRSCLRSNSWRMRHKDAARATLRPLEPLPRSVE
jgi:hypothetical protein